MESSILKTIKKPLNISADDDAFNDDLILFINSELAVVRQLGPGLSAPLVIVDDTTTWADLFGEDTELIQLVKSYIYLGTRIKFDPPTSGPALNSLKESRTETGWRITES